MLNVVMLNVIILNVIKLNVIMQNVVAPLLLDANECCSSRAKRDLTKFVHASTFLVGNYNSVSAPALFPVSMLIKYFLRH
jgi:hypothetical protein